MHANILRKATIEFGLQLSEETQIHYFMSRSHALGTWDDFINHVLVNMISQTLWRDLQPLELVLFRFYGTSFSPIVADPPK